MGKIFWFSATGNSYKAAKIISEISEGGYELVKITDSLIASSPVYEESDIGFVFPVFSWTLPEPVKDFIRASEFRNVKYCFSVITMGGSAGRCGSVLRKMLSCKGVTLSFVDTVRMPDNCIYLYNPSASKGGDYIDGVISESMEALSGAAEKISRKQQMLKISRNPAGWLLTYGIGSVFPLQYNGFDSKFSVSEDCTGCGICADVCSVSNIKLENGKPVFQGKCVICMGCINWCPEKAINYKESTSTRTRYHYPGLNSSEIK